MVTMLNYEQNCDFSDIIDFIGHSFGLYNICFFNIESYINICCFGEK